MKIVIAADHAGFLLKEEIITWLQNKGYMVEDIGTFSEQSVDYPPLAKSVASLVAEDSENRGILFCGSGHGMAIAANKVQGVRAISARSATEAKQARADGDINVISLGARVMVENEARNIISAFLDTPFSKEERHVRRIKQIEGEETDTSAFSS